MENKKLSGHIALFSANIIFGINTTISRSLMPDILSPYSLTFFRLIGAAILFWSFSLIAKKERVPAKDILLLFFASLLSLTFNQMPYFIGLSMTSPIDASIVVTMLPIITMLLAALLLREPITLKKALGVLIGATGTLLLVLKNNNLKGGESNLAGNLIVLGAVVSFSLYLTLFKPLIMRYSSITIMKWMFLFGTIVSFPFCYHSLTQINVSALSASTYWRIGYVVVLSTFVTYLLIPVGQKVLRPTTLSMYNYLQPIVASLLAIAIGLDHFGLQQGLAAVLVFVGVFIVTNSKSRDEMIANKISRN